MTPELKAAAVPSVAAIALTVVFHDPIGWSAKKRHRNLSPEQIPERSVHDETAKAPIDPPKFVEYARHAWPLADVRTVHTATWEAASGPLLRSDLGAGSLPRGISDGSCYVSRRKVAWK